MIEKIAAQLYTLRDTLKTPADMATTLKEVKAIGFQAVQVSGIGPIEPADLKKICDDNELIICATHTGYEELMEDLDTVIATHKTWDCKQCAVPVTPDQMRNEKGYIEFAKQMSGVGEKLAAEGIVLSYHNHSFEFQKYNGKTGLELIYANSDPKFFQGEIDTYWIQHGGGDVVMWCRKLKGRLPLVHLKDYVVTADGPDFCEILEGNLNWPAIFKACQDAGTEWYPIEQDTCPGEPIESLRLSFNNLKGFFSEN